MTYTYEDMQSETLIYMRQNLLRIGSSHRIGRCDGKGPFVTFTEGGNWFGNRVRSLFGYTQAMTFEIFLDDVREGSAMEAGGGDIPSVTFRNENGDATGSAVLQNPNLHGSKEHWLVQGNQNVTNAVPYWVNSAATLLFAIHEINTPHAHAAATSLAALAQAPRKFLSDNATEVAVPRVAGQPAAVAAQAKLSGTE